MSASGNSATPVRFETWRLFALSAVILLVLAVLLARLLSLQVVGSPLSSETSSPLGPRNRAR